MFIKCLLISSFFEINLISPAVSVEKFDKIVRKSCVIERCRYAVRKNE